MDHGGEAALELQVLLQPRSAHCHREPEALDGLPDQIHGVPVEEPRTPALSFHTWSTPGRLYGMTEGSSCVE